MVGRLRANGDRHPEACVEVAEFGCPLPSNVALEFSIQYRSAIAFGALRVLAAADERRHALNGLLRKYFPAMAAGRDYRPVTERELARTSAYALAVGSWSGKENWPDRADQSDEWPPLADRWLE